MTQSAKIVVSVRDGLLEISGSEDFVRDQLENFNDLIMKHLYNMLKSAQPSIFPSPQPALEQEVQGDAWKSVSYHKVIAFEGDEIKILKNIPGKSEAEKAVNAALLYLYAKNVKGQEEALFKEIRELCKSHGCLDSANFASNLKSEKQYFIIGGSGKKQTAKLTQPGKTKAAALVGQLNS
ncbi:hypothetical protein MYX84_02955 [Acidobacteria bacterium AH-259-O06]|nr:hypothetical protein [Acidobacteria bacterium AH-259-O06]